MVVYEDLHKRYGFSASQKKIIDIVGNKKIVLEVGASVGYMTRVFLKNSCIVDVVENDREAVKKIPKGARKILKLSIEDPRVISQLNKDYDFIIFADVLEHLVSPEIVLKKILKVGKKQTKLIISMPNIASWVIRKELFLKGDFEYQESGILDKTHLHFYTIKTLPKLIADNGWKVEELIGTITRLPFEQSIKKIPVISFLINILRKLIVNQYKNLTYEHFVLIALKK